jgi:hypothetical protein
MTALVDQIEANPQLSRLYAWTSMHDLQIVQTPVTHPYEGPRLVISPKPDDTIEFRYVDTEITSRQWHRIVAAPEAFSRLLRFTDQLHWFARPTTPE